jgi:hypothetical protein
MIESVHMIVFVLQISRPACVLGSHPRERTDAYLSDKPVTSADSGFILIHLQEHNLKSSGDLRKPKLKKATGNPASETDQSQTPGLTSAKVTVCHGLPRHHDPGDPPRQLGKAPHSSEPPVSLF